MVLWRTRLQPRFSVTKNTRPCARGIPKSSTASSVSAGRKPAARKAAFRPTYPVSTLVEVSGLVFPDLLVEIDAFANLDLSLQQD